MNVSLKTVAKPMGNLMSSENSLNQHIKLKHPELWTKLKDLESEVNNGPSNNTENKLNKDGLQGHSGLEQI